MYEGENDVSKEKQAPHAKEMIKTWETIHRQEDIDFKATFSTVGYLSQVFLVDEF